MSTGTESLIANACLGVVCCLWPGLIGFVCFNVGRHGLRGWVRLSLERAKASLPPERGAFSDD